EAFQPQILERHPILAGWDKLTCPPLLGYVKTLRKSTAQVPLVTETGDPLLAHWRFGLGKVTAFTSDAKSRWAGLWISQWSGFGQFWSQVLRETARPPQGQGLDVRTELQNGEAKVSVDVLADAGTRSHEARVTADVFFASSASLGAPLRPLHTLSLRQTGPGLYEGAFTPEQPGVYLTRAHSGAQMVTTGFVYNPSNEQSLGTVQEKLLREVCAVTHGTYMEDAVSLELGAARARRYVELWPALLVALLLVFLIDVAVRRWEHVTGLSEGLTAWVRSKRL
ncbi:MAG: glutamine amidotransferase, partial [Roseimicrobium sp.]